MRGCAKTARPPISYSSKVWRATRNQEMMLRAATAGSIRPRRLRFRSRNVERLRAAGVPGGEVAERAASGVFVLDALATLHAGCGVLRKRSWIEGFSSQQTA